MFPVRRLSKIAVSTIAVPLAIACSGGGGSGTSTLAGNPAIDVTSLTAGGFDYTQGSYEDGFAFTVNQVVKVTALGYWDSNLEGSAKETFKATPVALYDMTTSTELGTVTVSASDPADGFFRYHALSTPISLNTTDSYAVVAITGSNYYVAGEGSSCVGGFACSNHTVDSAITVSGGACLGSGCLTETSTLTLPNDNETWIDLSANLLIE
jgi:hypothetical protein